MVATPAMQVHRRTLNGCSTLSFATSVGYACRAQHRWRVAGIFRKGIAEADQVWCSTPFAMRHSARFGGQQRLDTCAKKSRTPTARRERSSSERKRRDQRLPASAAFAMACQAKSGLAQSMARELMPQGIHVANVPIDAAIADAGDGSRGIDSPERPSTTTWPTRIVSLRPIATHRQHRSTWAFEVVLRPWVENGERAS